MSGPAPSIFGVCGHPLAQSLSPALHTWALESLGIAGTYGAWDVPPEALAAFVRDMRSTPYAGASVTIPHKVAVIPFLDGLTPEAETIGAVNTLFWRDGGLLGHNTDMEGFLTPLAGSPAPETALVLGAGGAARAVLAGLASLKVPRLILTARGRDKAEALARDAAGFFASLTVLDWDNREKADVDGAGALVVNTTPLGMRGKAEGASPLSGEWFAARRGASRQAYDLVYNPLKTAFLALAENAGWTCRDGLDMFIAQGAAQFRLWTGLDMPLSPARDLLVRRLAA